MTNVEMSPFLKWRQEKNSLEKCLETRKKAVGCRQAARSGGAEKNRPSTAEKRIRRNSWHSDNLEREREREREEEEEEKVEEEEEETKPTVLLPKEIAHAGGKERQCIQFVRCPWGHKSPLPSLPFPPPFLSPPSPPLLVPVSPCVVHQPTGSLSLALDVP